jgi:hypothetical protein
VLELEASVGVGPVVGTGPVLELPGAVLPLLLPLVVSTPLPVIGRLALNEPSVVSAGSLQPTSPTTIIASAALVCP